MVKLRDLQYLIAIDDYKHFGKAAEACHVSQPTLSGQVIKLEEQLSLQLIERHKRKVLLTPAGELLIKEARKVIAAAEQLETQAAALLDPLAGDLHVGLIPTLAPYILPHIMQPLINALPKINFYLHEEKTQDLLAALNNGELDCLILPYLKEVDPFEYYELFDEALVLAVSTDHYLASRESVSLDDLNDQQVLTLEDGHCLRDQAMGYCFSAGAREDQRFKAASLETLRHMVAARMGVTLMPQLATHHRQMDETIHYIPFSEPKPSRKIVLVMRANYSRMEVIRAVVKSVKLLANNESLIGVSPALFQS